MIRLFKHYSPHAVLLLGLFDFALLVTAGEFAWELRAAQIGIEPGTFRARAAVLLGGAVVVQVAMIAVGVYGADSLRSMRYAGARLLVTATQDTVHLWDTASGNRAGSLPVGAGSPDTFLTEDGAHVFVQRRSDVETTLELWSLETATVVSTLQVAGTPALVALDRSGRRVAVADFDRAVRVWDMAEGTLAAQIDLPLQPSEIGLASGGDVLAAVFRENNIKVPEAAGAYIFSMAGMRSVWWPIIFHWPFSLR